MALPPFRERDCISGICSLDHDVGGARDLKFFRPSRQRIPDELDGGESDGADVGLLEAAGPPRVSGSESTLPVLYQGDFRIGCI